MIRLFDESTHIFNTYYPTGIRFHFGISFEHVSLLTRDLSACGQFTLHHERKLRQRREQFAIMRFIRRADLHH